MAQVRAADVLAQRLYAAGCRHAFGMPGGEVLTLVDALEKAGITFVLAKHENAAGFMAEGVYHRTGVPGILVATVGPGALNGINVVENARQDRVPLIVLTGAVDAGEAETYTHQVLDQPQVFRPITKHSFTFVPDAAQVIADKAVNLAMDPQPGPVHIDVPISAADTLVETRGAPLRAAHDPVVPAAAVLKQMATDLSAAQRPVMVVGVDAIEARAAQAVKRFAEQQNIPVITTYKAKGVVPEDHPLALGGAGLSPKADALLLPILHQADVVLAVGYDPIEMRVGWKNPWDPVAQKVIELTTVANTHYMHHATQTALVDIAAALEALAAVSPSDHALRWAGGEIDAAKAALDAAFPRGENWGPAAVMDTCRQVLPRDTVASADSGAHRILLSQMWECYEPRGLVQSSGLCTMGCAVPLAMGMSLAEPERVSVSFSGDAGFLMVAGELATAAELKLKTIFVVFVDASLALIEKKQRERQLSNAGVDFVQHDFAALGRALGGGGVTVRDRDALRAALQDAVTSDRFTVIAAVIEKGAYDGRL
ncbi:thiamine pyrophosphate-binding protein [Shimia sp. R11_0]|uniref:thiamine pyrophosphate-binding protein n=1 Tax=Shimia sp. R11_0 TaxID=2821096 RepID=UPI001FFDFA92|nr:thiamine pyrophosphate-binding protein [Shimia sp. R11_0]